MAETVPGNTVSQDDSATLPALIVTNFFTGNTPLFAKLADLSAFAQVQYAYYASIGVGQPLLGPYEALGRGFAETDGFKAKYGVLTTDFVETAYNDVFGRAPTAAQEAHFDAQVSYFISIYSNAGIAADTAALLAKGAVIGQMLGVAALTGDSAFDYSAAAKAFIAQMDSEGFVPGQPLSNFDDAPTPGPGPGPGPGPDVTAPVGTVDPLSAGDQTFKAGEVVTFTVNFSENVVITGTPELALSNNGVAVLDPLASTASKLVFTYTVAAGDDVADLEVTGLGATGTVKDAAGNAAVVTATTALDIIVDTTAPAGTVAPASAGDGTFKAGEVITFSVDFSEDVVATGAVDLALSNGGFALLNAGASTASNLVFNYTVGANETVADLEVVGLGPTGTVKDAAGNAATVTATAALDIVVDTTAPVGVVDTAASTTGSVAPGGTLTFVVDFSEDVVANGAIALALTGGRAADFVSNAGTQYTFAYTVKPTDVVADLEVLGLTGTVTDPAGNAASVTPTSALDIQVGPGNGQIFVFDAADALVAVYGTVAGTAAGMAVTVNATPLQAAVNSAFAVDGGTILMGSGNFTVPATIEVGKELTFLGANHAFDPTETGGPAREAETVLVGANLANGAFQIVLQAPGNHTDNVTFAGLVFDGFTSNANSNMGVINLKGTAVNHNLKIENNIFEDSNIPAFNAQSGTDAYLIKNNVFQNFASTGYSNMSAIEITTSNSGGSSNGVIDSNVFTNIRGKVGPGATPADESHAFILGGGSSGGGKQLNTVVSDNLIDGTDASGMRIQGALDSVKIFGNTVVNANAINKADDAAIRIQLNTATGPIQVFDNEISGSFNAFSLAGSGGNIAGPVPQIYSNDISGITGLAFTSFIKQVVDYTGVANTLDGTSIYAVVGSQGSDTISFPAAAGGAGLYIIGGSGNDAMTATTGNDVFLFGAGTSGIDTITGFAAGDKLDVRPANLTFATLDSNANLVLDDADNAVAVAGGNLSIALSPGNTVTLQGIASLTATDFVI
jgi:hypothetical protein